MAENIQNIKKQQMQNKITQFKGIQALQSGFGTSIYDDLQQTREENESYTCCSPGNLQYEDIRKVHKDETVFSAHENEQGNRDINNLGQLLTARSEQILTPLDKTKSMIQLQENEKLWTDGLII